jgi:chromosomal replication initiator protein
MAGGEVQIADVIGAVAHRFGVTSEEICGPRRMKEIVRPRQIAYLIAASVCPRASLPAIGRAFGDRDHTTILWGIRRVREAMAADPKLAATVREIESGLRREIPAWLAEVA